MALDTSISHYSTGTASVANGATLVTGQGTSWATLRKGDLFGTHVGMPVRIASVDSDTSLTLAYPWPGPAQTAAAYEIQRTPADMGYLEALEQLIALLGAGSLEELAALDGAGGDKLPYMDGPNSFALTTFRAWARSMLSLTAAADRGIYFTGANTAALFQLTAAGRALLDDADASAQLTTLGVSAFIKTLLDDANAAAARATLALPWEPLASGSLVGLTASPVFSLAAGYKRFQIFLQDLNWAAGDVQFMQFGNGSTFFAGAVDYTNTRIFTGAAQTVGQFDSSGGYLVGDSGGSLSGNQQMDVMIDIWPGSAATRARATVDASYRNSGGAFRRFQNDIRLNQMGRAATCVTFPAGGVGALGSGTYTLLGLRN